MIGIDIGKPSVRGSTLQVPGGFDITSGGTDIWGSSDQFHFAYEPGLIEGDFDIKIRIERLGSADLYTKAGLMARESLDAGSRHVYILAFPDNSPRNNNNGGFEFQYRASKDGGSLAIYPPPDKSGIFPVEFPDPGACLRLARSGSMFDAYIGKSMTEWVRYSSLNLELNPGLFIGFAVTSHNDKKAVTAGFRDFSPV